MIPKIWDQDHPDIIFIFSFDEFEQLSRGKTVTKIWILIPWSDTIQSFDRMKTMMIP